MCKALNTFFISLFLFIITWAIGIIPAVLGFISTFVEVGWLFGRIQGERVCKHFRNHA